MKNINSMKLNCNNNKTYVICLNHNYIWFILCEIGINHNGLTSQKLIDVAVNSDVTLLNFKREILT